MEAPVSETHFLQLPYLAAAQAQKHVTVNETLRQLDAMMFLSALSRSLTTPPTSPSEGDRYVVPVSASGAWSGKTHQIAAWMDGTWLFLEPRSGWRLWLESEGLELRFNGTTWLPLVSAASGASTVLRVIDETVTLSGAFTETTLLIPNRAIVLAVSTKVVSTVTGATSYECGIVTETSKFGGSLGIAVGSSNVGVIGPTAFYSATPIRLTAVGGSFSGGSIRVSLHYIEVSAPIS
jgi:Protein of unknown function (DUF2793)